MFISRLSAIMIAIVFGLFYLGFTNSICKNKLIDSDPPSFTDISEGIDPDGILYSAEKGSHAAVLCDVDSDGLPDVYFTMLFDKPMSDLFFRNNGNFIHEEGTERGIDSYDGGSHGACFADFDNDGDYDFINGTTNGFDGHPPINIIYRNIGKGFFTEVVNVRRISKSGWPTRGVIVFDMENDGDLDIFCITNYLGSDDSMQERNEIYRNDGEMKFTEIKAEGLYSAPVGQGGTDTDYDNDGDIDLIVANRTGDLNILNNNGAGLFTLIPPARIGIEHLGGDGITMGDFDNDQDLDLVLVDKRNGFLYRNNGDGTFSFVRSFLNISGYMGGFADLDNDTDLDLVFAGDDICYLNDGIGNFYPGPAIPVSGIGDPRSIAFADLENDGDVDLFIGCKRSRNFIIRNELYAGNWLKIKLISPRGQAGAFGAKVKIYRRFEDDREIIGFREARSVNGYLAQNDPVLHFGVDKLQYVDVEVLFLDGSRALRRNVSVNQTVVINGNDDEPRYHLTVRGGSGDGNYIADTIVDIKADSLPTDPAFLFWSGDVAYMEDVRARNTRLIMPKDDVTITANFQSTSRLWAPFYEWSVENVTYSGNPFDLTGTVTFTHARSGVVHKTEMFYDGNDTWKFRFTGTATGMWEFDTGSDDPELNGIRGTILIKENPDPNILGFVRHDGSKWVKQGSDRAFIPQYVMYDNPATFFNNPEKIDEDIRTFIGKHGFTGFHVPVNCRWFDLHSNSSNDILIPNPDPRTFEALELLITKVHAAGGVVHLWAWGDEFRKWTPVKWGLNGAEDRRLQRYIAARLGPLPGWTMEYGFDLDEWVVKEDLEKWHNFLHAHFGWQHYLGGRNPGPNFPGQPFNQISENLDYASYEQHRPDYERYVQTINARPGKPSFSEDRFRIRGTAVKDYTMSDTRMGLWRSAMAGGVANIWGNLIDAATGKLTDGNLYGSQPYPKPEWIKTYSLFFANRFLKELQINNEISDAVCLQHPEKTHFLFYKENANTIRMNLTEMGKLQPAVVIDTKLPYSEKNLGYLWPVDQIWTAPYFSDWAIAVGDFRKSDAISDVEENSFTSGQFSCRQNYPNPFNGETTIEFYIFKPAKVLVRIYDVQGKVVRQFNRSGKKGINRIIWDGNNRNGKQTSSGFYFCSIRYNQRSYMKKMLKLK